MMASVSLSRPLAPSSGQVRSRKHNAANSNTDDGRGEGEHLFSD
jgi:hypothetical protein